MPEILPQDGKKNILITSALPYVNNVPHLGNIIGSVLSADVFSRYCKARGLPTLFICGTDEYGTATETAALAAGLTPQELCDHFHLIHTQVYDYFNISFDKWGRTPTNEQTEIAQDIFLKLHKNGFLEEQTSIQPFCEAPGHESFLADRFIEGTCPLCGFNDARGDQCDNCGNLLDPAQLKNPRCKIDGTAPVLKETTHVYILLDKLQPEIEKWYHKSKDEGKWSSNGTSITESWLKTGLQPRAITRDLKWGTPVPLPGYEKKVLYVWFDACIGYVSITATYTKEWEKWWKNPESVSLYQFMGKDNVPFHSVIFPGSQLGTRENWTQVHTISTTEYLTYEGGKFSKSRGTGVFGDSAKATGVPSDIFRYYLISRRPEGSDTDFEWGSLIDANNNELLANLGNYINRVLVFTNKKYNSEVPDYTKFNSPAMDAWKEELNKLLAEYNTEFTNVKLRSSLALAMRIASLGNKLLQDNKLDNKTFESEPAKTATVIGTAINLIALLVSIFKPFMPSITKNIASQINVPEDISIPDVFITDAVKPGHKIGTAERLFSIIDPKKADEWRDQFGGEELKKMKAEAEAATKAKAEKKRLDKERKKAKKAAAKDGEGKDKEVDVQEIAKKVEELRT